MSGCGCGYNLVPFALLCLSSPLTVRGLRSVTYRCRFALLTSFRCRFALLSSPDRLTVAVSRTQMTLISVKPPLRLLSRTERHLIAQFAPKLCPFASHSESSVREISQRAPLAGNSGLSVRLANAEAARESVKFCIGFLATCILVSTCLFPPVPLQ